MKPAAVWTPLREGDGLTTFHACSRCLWGRPFIWRGRQVCPTECGLGHVSPPVARHLRWGSSEPHGPGHIPFWSKRVSSLRLAFMTTVATFHHRVDPATRSWFPTAVLLAVAASARAFAALPEEEATLSRGLRTPPLPATHAPVGYCWQNSRCCQSAPRTAAQLHRRHRVAIERPSSAAGRPV